MSVEGSRRAIDWPGGSPVERHILAVIGIATDHHTDWARLTLDELAQATGYARGSVTKILRRLVEAGALSRRGSGGRHPSEYQVNRRPTDAPEESVGGAEPTPNRRPTDAQPTPGERQKPRACRDRDRDREKQPPLIPPAALERVRPEVLLPAPTPNGVTARASDPDGFHAFYSDYPRHVSRTDAARAYATAVRRDGPDVIATGLAAWVAHWTADATEDRYIPHPATWLNKARYLDAPPRPAARRDPVAEAVKARIADRHRGQAT